MRQMTPEEHADEVRFIKEEPLWPMWPVLPVKRRQEGGPDTGVVVAGKTVVYLINMFALETGPLSPQLEGVETEEFDSHEAMVDAGWIAD